jgi:CXXX repeat modification system protein
VEDCKKTGCGYDSRSVVGWVTARERDEILALFERKNGLAELAHALAAADDEVLKNSYFYDKLVMDMGKTTTKYQQWWDMQAKIHQWEKAVGEVWEIDFDTCQVFLRKP